MPKLMKCPKCSDLLYPTISYMAPIYETTICFKCGGLFYELKDKSQLEEITNNARAALARQDPSLLPIVKRMIESV